MSEVCSRCWRAHRSQALVRGRASEPQQRSVATATEFHGLRYGMGYARTTGRKDGSGADGRALEFSIAACHVLCRELHTEERAVLPILMDPMSQSRLSSTQIPRELFISLTTAPHLQFFRQSETPCESTVVGYQAFASLLGPASPQSYVRPTHDRVPTPRLFQNAALVSIRKDKDLQRPTVWTIACFWSCSV